MAETPRERLLALRLAKLRAAQPELSFAQERFWFLDQLEPGSTEFHITAAAQLTGPLDREALGLAAQGLATRHEVLRSSYPAKDGRPTVHVDERAPAVLHTAALDSGQGVEEAIRRAHAEPFELQRGPLWRVELIELGPDEHLLILVLHHIISDGWSVGLMAAELAERYNRLAQGATFEEAPAPPSFRVLARAERRALEGPRLAELVAFWRRTLEGASDAVSLPYDHPLPALATHAGRTLAGQLSPAASAQVRSLAGELAATPFQVLLALFGGFLARISGSSDLVIGTSYAGRDRAGSQAVLGALVGTLALRLGLDLAAPLRSAVAVVRRTLRSATAHSELPFEKLIAELGPPRDARRTPLFNVFFELVVRPKLPTWSGLTLCEVEVDLGEAPFDLALSVDVTPAAFGLRLQYKTALFEPETAEELFASLMRFAEAALAAPDQALAAHALVDPSRLAEQLAPASALAPFEPVAETLARAAAAHAERIAIEAHGTTLTYGELDARAARLAAAIHQRFEQGGGAPPGTPVGVHLERSAEAVIAALAIWKAGCAYVPLDPAEPPARRAKLLGALDLALTITQDATGPKQLNASAWRDQASGLSPRPVAPTDTAYIIFTSGSTGVPKGVLIPQRALANHIAWVREAFAFPPATRVALRTPLGFDASLWELVNPLAAGATLVVASRDEAQDAHALFELAKRARVTVIQTVPSILRAWLEEPGFDELKELDTLICAGEALPHELAAEVRERFRRAGSGARLYNLYGPTEACIDATFEPVEAEPAGCHSVPIGRPIRGMAAVVLDDQGRPLPDGVTGELWLFGTGLATGYLGMPEETAARFVELKLAGATLRGYRTGDRARRLAGARGDGRFEAMGRGDGQVKVRGQRIEVGEIEAALLGQPGVRQAAVVARERGGATSLHAFVVGDEDEGLAVALAERLPRSMVPASITWLEALPATSSEKTDRRALLDLVPEPQGVLGAKGAAPRGDLEVFLRRALADLLGVPEESLSREDDFFALGGHSLLATRWLARARKHFGVELSLRELFERPTIAALARSVESALATGRREAPIVPRTGGEPCPLSRAQERLWLLIQRGVGAGAYNMPGGLWLRGGLDVSALEAALTELIARHATLRTRLVELPPGSRFVAAQVIDAPRAAHLDVVTHADKAQVEAWLRSEARRQPNLATEALFRFQLFQLEPDEHALVFNLHHIVGDGWSLGIFARELGELYRAAMSGDATRLAALQIDFADYAAWEREAEPPHLGEWRGYLQGAPALREPLALPFNRPRPAARDGAGGELVLELPPDLTRALHRHAREERVSLHPLLLATFACCLSRITGEADLVVGAPVAGRSRPETQGLIGFFVSALPIRIRLDEARDFAAALAETRRASGFVIEREDTGLDELLADLGEAGMLQAEGNATSLFQVGFDFAPEPLPTPELEGLEVERIEFHSGTAKLDLNVLVEEVNDRLVVRAEFASDVFERGRIEGLMGLWFELARELLSQPARRLSELPLGSASQREAWLHEGIGAPPASSPTTVVQQLAALADCDREALALGDVRWSFRELNQHAARLAARIDAELSLGPLALELERSPELVAWLFATWRTGRAWLALDPKDPPERRRSLVRAAGVTALASRDPKKAHALGLAWISPELPGPHDALLADDRAETSGRAYFMATSGTTGTPKCIAVGHRALANHNLAIGERLGIGPADGVFARIPLTFDAALLELVTPLALGARVVLASEDEVHDPGRAAARLQAEEITTVIGVPAWLEALLERAAGDALPHLKRIISGGEAPSPRLLELWRAMAPRPALFNAYGPAECCIEVTAFEAPADAPWPLPIGTPLAGTQAHVLDPAGRPLPPGIEGELVLGGAAVAEGYVGEAAAEGSRFTSNHLTGKGRLYWSGDRAVRREDGLLEFRGRHDRQLKVGGRRMDPAELEAVLTGHPEVRAAAVVASPREPLLAHVELAGPAREELLLELKERVAKLLPPGCMPSAWRWHKELWRQPGGKLDLARLASHPLAGVEWAERPAEAQSPLEAQLIALFTQHFGQAAGGHTDFFRAGGSSLDAIGFVDTLRAALDVPLRLRDFFGAPTPRALARLLEGERGPREGSPWQRMCTDAIFAPSERRGALRTSGAVLLTGATGFLGAFLLAELLARDAREVICLVRAQDAAAARERLAKTLASYGLDEAVAQLHRVRVLAGDLAAPRLGLTPRTWSQLAGATGHVLHNGAAVDFFRDYSALAPANVEGTRTALELAWQAGASFDLVSTIGVVAGAPGAVSEDTGLDAIRAWDRLEGGYEQTKWVAEALVESARDQGLPTRTFRPGRISASTSGASNPSDFASRFLTGCLELGLAPGLDGDTGEAAFDVTPVDFAARAILALGGLAPEDASARGTRWHILHPSPAPYCVFFDAAKQRGYPLEYVPLAEWLERARAAQLPRLAPLLAGLEAASPDVARRKLTPDSALGRVDSSASHAALAARGLHAPPIEKVYALSTLAGLEGRSVLSARAQLQHPGARPPSQ